MHEVVREIERHEAREALEVLEVREFVVREIERAHSITVLFVEYLGDELELETSERCVGFGGWWYNVFV